MEAAFAGALGLTLGGPLRYGERTEDRPRLGDGRDATPADARRAARLSLAVGAGTALVCAAGRGAARRCAAGRALTRHECTQWVSGTRRSHEAGEATA